MYWLQKARILCTTQQRANQLENQINTQLAGVSLRNPVFIQQIADAGQPRPRLVIYAEYLIKAEADNIWAQITTANTNGWIVSESVVIYAAMNDDGSLNTLIDRQVW